MHSSDFLKETNIYFCRLCIIERDRSVVTRVIKQVKQKTIRFLFRGTLAEAALVNTDEYNIYARLEP